MTPETTTKTAYVTQPGRGALFRDRRDAQRIYGNLNVAGSNAKLSANATASAAGEKIQGKVTISGEVFDLMLTSRAASGKRPSWVGELGHETGEKIDLVGWNSLSKAGTKYISLRVNDPN